jgi:hypothetical protein
MKGTTMIRKLIVPLLVLGAIAFAVLAPAASAGSKQVYVENLESAFASFYTEDGCFRVSGVVVIGEDTTMVNQGEDRAGTNAFAFIDIYDACERQWVLMAETGGENLNVDISPNLRSASIDDTVIARNYLADEDVAIHFALTWQGSGPQYHDRDVVEVEYPGPDGTTVYAISRAGYHWVNAVATGTIAIGDHVIPIQEEYAEIFGVKGNTHQTIE